MPAKQENRVMIGLVSRHGFEQRLRAAADSANLPVSRFVLRATEQALSEAGFGRKPLHVVVADEAPKPRRRRRAKVAA